MLLASYQIATGLIRSGRADPTACHFREWIRLACRNGTGFYWISDRELRRGLTLGDAEPLQASFVAAMRRLGGWVERKRSRPPRAA